MMRSQFSRPWREPWSRGRILRRVRRMAFVGLVAVAAAGLAVRLSAQRSTPDATPANFDLRADVAGAAVFLARHSAPVSFAAVARARATGIGRLRAAFDGIDVV